jgi:hypothetical protein
MLKLILCDFFGIHRTDVVLEEPTSKEDGIHFGVKVHCGRCGRVNNHVQWRLSVGSPTSVPAPRFEVHSEEDLECN